MTRLTIICISFIIVSLMFAGQSSAKIDPETILGIWLLDEGKGDITEDSSGNGHDGTLGGGPTWIDGVYGKALDFSGSSSYVDCGSDPTLNVGVFSVSFWCNIPSTQSWNHIVSRGEHHGGGNPGAVNWGVMMYADQETILYELYNDTVKPSLSANTTTGEWHHVVATHDGATMQLYHDGQLAGTSPATGILLDENLAFIIGAQSRAGGPSDYFNGSIDEVGYFNAVLSPEDIQTIMNNGLADILPASTVAVNPRPADGATDVPRDVVLSWKPGAYAPPISGHKVYFSENFSDVNDDIGGIAQSATTYAPAQRLDFNKTYYWRVDEVNGPPDFTVYEGKVWSFTTELLAYPIENITATASSSVADGGPENTINGSGLDDSGLLHSIVGDFNMWLSDAAGPQPTWIEYEFDNVYKLHEMWVWNSNTSLEPVIGFGFKDVTIEYSANGTDYTTLGTAHEFARAPGAPDYEHNTTVDLSDVGAKYVRLTANSNWGGILNQYGLSEVRFFYIPVLAREPNPESGATDVSIGTIDAPTDVTLRFRAGREAAKHNVYFGSDWQAVIDGTAAVTTVTEAGHGPLSLDLAQTYYWRVDEVNEAETPATWQSAVWDFTTQEYFVVDDIENYNDLDPTDPNSNRIFLTWLDGYEVATNGSLVGYDVPSFAEQTIVHGGNQSMPFFFDNSGTAQYSEATLTLSPQQDWTIKGIEALVLWFKGNRVAFIEEPPGTFTVNASGVDIWDTSDEFRYVWKQLSGDGEIIAQVLSVEQTDDWAKAGVMIRDTLDADSPNVFVAITGGGGDGATFQRRTAPGGTSSSSRTLVGISPPASVKLVRKGILFTGYVFLDGQWQQEGQLVAVQMTDPVYIGLAVTSQAAGVTCEAVFSDIQINGAVSGQFTEQAIGVDMPSNSQAPMYVVLANSGGTPVTVYHDDPSALQISDWTQWLINLKQFSDGGVNLTNVNTISIGFGDKANPQPGGAGLVFVDDIRLYPHIEPPDEIQLEAEAADSITEPMKVYDGLGASGGQYIGTDDGIGDENSNPPADGIATYSFTAKGGTYKILLSVIITGGSNSFWVRIPGAISYDPGTDPLNPGWIRFNDIDDGDTWHWDEVHSDDHDEQVVLIKLPPGPHTLEIARRGDGALLDAILITDAVD